MFKSEEKKNSFGRVIGIETAKRLMLYLIIIFAFASCQKEQKQESGDSQAQAADKKAGADKTAADVKEPAKDEVVTISINNAALEDAKYDLAQQEYFYSLWQKEYPNIKIKFDPWQYSAETFQVKIKGGTATDIVGLHATEGTMVIEKGFALDITGQLKKWDKFELINKEILGSFQRDGKIYGVPVPAFSGAGYVMTLFYNKAMFKAKGIVDANGNPKPPETWEEFVETAKKLTDKEKGVAGFGILGEMSAAGWHFLNWVWQAGGDFEKKVDGKWVATFDSPEAVKALQFIKDLKWKHDVLQNDILCDNDSMFELFTAERIGMAIFTPEYLRFLVEKYKFPYEKIGIALLPAGPAGRANQMGGSYFIVNPSISKEKAEAAIKFIEFYFKPEVIEARVKFQKEKGKEMLGVEPMIGWGVLPMFKPEYQKQLDLIIDKYRTVDSQDAMMQEAVKYVHTEPPFYSQQLYGEALGAVIQAVLTNKDADPAALLKEKNEMFQKRFLDKVKE